MTELEGNLEMMNSKACRLDVPVHGEKLAQPLRGKICRASEG